MDRTHFLGLILLVVVVSAAVSSLVTIEYMSTFVKPSVSMVTKTPVVTTPFVWQLDDLVSGSSVGRNSVSLNGLFSHSANAAIIVIVYSNNVPSSLTVTSEITLSLLVSGGNSKGQPSIAIYAGSAATSNPNGNITANFSTNQGTALLIAMSWTYPGMTTFTFNNYAVGTTWSATTSLQVTQSADPNGNTNRLCLFFASIYSTGGQPTAINDPHLTVLGSQSSYQASPQTSFFTQIGYDVNEGGQTVVVSSSDLAANGVLYPFIGVDPEGQTFSGPNENYGLLDQGYARQRLGQIAVRALLEPGVKSTLYSFSEQYLINGSAYNYTWVESELGSGNFSSGGAVVHYGLSLSEWRLSRLEYPSNGTVLYKLDPNQHLFQGGIYDLGIGLSGDTTHGCNLSWPKSDINCNAILVFNFQNSTSGQTRQYILTASNATVYFFDRDPPTYFLGSQITFLLRTFQGYSWCPIQGVGNATKLLCEYNPDYGYETIVSKDAQGLASTGYFNWRNIALNYSFSHSTGLLKVTVQSGPICDVKKSLSKANCQGMLLIGFEVTPPLGGIHEIVFLLPVGKTETFSLYPTVSNVQQQLYIILGSYIGNYDGLLCSTYSPDLNVCPEVP